MPQVAVQEDQFPQSPHLQSAGQSLKVHSRDWFTGPVQSMPVPTSGTLTDLALVLLPDPQLAEQEDQRLQSPQAQFCGQVLLPQGLLWILVSLQSRPPLAAATAGALALCCTPTPQVTEQVDHGVQSPMTQLTGQLVNWQV